MFLVGFLCRVRISTELLSRSHRDKAAIKGDPFSRVAGTAVGLPWRPAAAVESPGTAAPFVNIATGRLATTRLATRHRASHEDRPRAAHRGSRIFPRLPTRSTPRRWRPPVSRKGSDVVEQQGTAWVRDQPDRPTTSRADRFHDDPPL